MFPMEMGACAHMAGPTWQHLYKNQTQFSLLNTYDAASWDNTRADGYGNYVPGHIEAKEYDNCVYDACQASKPGCDCGFKNGSPSYLVSEYSMPKSLRTSIFVLIVLNSLISWLYMTAIMNGPGAERLRQEKKNYIHLDL